MFHSLQHLPGSPSATTRPAATVSPRFLTTLGLLAAAFLPLGACSTGHAESKDTAVDPVAVGRHIVHEVAMCIDCHSPRLETGAFDEARHLQGSLLAFAPTIPMPWAPAAPGIAGASLGKMHLVTLLATGARPDGTTPRPPMPTYHFRDDEARAVVAYLESLGAPATD
jgi:mono/diheme cytochrome c family protein